MNLLLGADISSYQGTVDWNAYRSSGRLFVFAKATEGSTYVADTLSGDRSGALASGLLVGLYHFAGHGDPTTEAEFFLRTVGEIGPHELPVLDFEKTYGRDKSSQGAWAATWLATVSNKLGTTAIFYSYLSFLAQMDTSALTSYPLWIAAYLPEGTGPQGHAPGNTDRWDHYTFWQYTDRAAVPGVKGPCDDSVFSGDEAALSALFGGHGAPVAPSAGPPAAEPGGHSPFPGRLLTFPPVTVGSDVRTWQAQMAARGWKIAVDGGYGAASRDICAKFQDEKGLTSDGVVGPQTWDATFTAPVS